MEHWTEKVNKAGNDFVDNFFVPALKGLVTQADEVSTFLAFRTAFSEEKINRFIQFINEKDEAEIKDFIDNLNDTKRYFITQAINKTVDMDDFLQIFILANLTRQYLINGQLNYYEQSLFYNIGQFSNTDFLTYHKLIMTLELKYSQNDESDTFYDMTQCSEIEEIILRKFLAIGILKHEQMRFVGQTFLHTEYTKTLAKIIENYINLNDGNDF